MGLTDIEWAHYSWQPGIYGCEEISSACKNCYAAKMAHRQVAMGNYPEGITVKRASGVHWSGKVETLARPDTRGLPKRPRYGSRVFLTSMADVFHKDVPDGFVMNLWHIMAHRRDLTFLVLTKRPERMAAFLAKWADTSGDVEPKLARGPAEIRAQHTSGRAHLYADMLERWGEPPAGYAYPSYDWMEGPRGWPTILPNVWLGTTVENQQAADERIPHLLRCPAAVRFLSMEPLLGPVDFREVPGFNRVGLDLSGFWVIAGGESGPRARPSHPDWFRALRDQCSAAKVPFLFKQWGEWGPPGPPPWGQYRVATFPASVEGGPLTQIFRVGKKAAGRLLDGVEHSAFPVTP